jgi:hypothetical protein
MAKMMAKGSGKVLAKDSDSRAARAVDKAVTKVTGAPLDDEQRYRVNDAFRNFMNVADHVDDKELMGQLGEKASRIAKMVKKHA